MSLGASDSDRLVEALQRCVVFTWDAAGRLYRIKADPNTDETMADAVLRWFAHGETQE